METVEFRKLEKELVRGRIPLSLEKRLREEAFRKRTSLSAVLTLYVAEGLGVDPAVYGVSKRRRKPASAKA